MVFLHIKSLPNLLFGCSASQEIRVTRLRNRQSTLLRVASAGLVYWVARFFLLGKKARILGLTLGNLYSGQEATVRTGHGTTDWFQIGKGIHQGCIMSPCLFNLYAEYIIRNAGLERCASWNQDCQEKYQ